MKKTYVNKVMTLIFSFLLGIMSVFFASGIELYNFDSLYEERSPSSTIHNGNTLYVGGDGPGNYTRIQDAIDNASGGDTVFVYDDSSPYYENVYVEKSINLIGENRDTTIIDGMGNYNVMKIRADYVNISNFNLTNSIVTIHVYFAAYNTISSVIIHSDWIGIALDYSPHNTFLNNIIRDNDYGLWAEYSDNLIINNNNFSSNSDCGIRFSEIYGSLIINNFIVNNDEGINIGCSAASGNRIYHNNFINNSRNAQDWGNNIWDDGYPSGGNYWDDYNGFDNDSDGIGDTPYLIPGGPNIDWYPLMDPYYATSAFSIEIESGINLKVIIRNIGEIDATDVHWNIKAKGGVFGLIDKSTEGSTQTLLSGDAILERLLIFGYGIIEVIVTVSTPSVGTVEKTLYALVLLFLVLS